MKIETLAWVTAALVAPRLLLTVAIVVLGSLIPWMEPRRQAVAMKVLRFLGSLAEKVGRPPLRIEAAGLSIRSGRPDRLDAVTKSRPGSGPTDANRADDG